MNDQTAPAFPCNKASSRHQPAVRLAARCGPICSSSVAVWTSAGVCSGGRRHIRADDGTHWSWAADPCRRGRSMEPSPSNQTVPHFKLAPHPAYLRDSPTHPCPFASLFLSVPFRPLPCSYTPRSCLLFWLGLVSSLVTCSQFLAWLAWLAAYCGCGGSGSRLVLQASAHFPMLVLPSKVLHRICPLAHAASAFSSHSRLDSVSRQLLALLCHRTAAA